MAEVETSKALLLDALQDLADAETALVERLGDIVDQVTDSGTAAILDRYGQAAVARRRGLEGAAERSGGDTEGAPNIWMRAVLDDAERDTETVMAGRLLDIALIGAIRKGAQAARVSYETAVLVADACGHGETAEGCRKGQAAHAACDEALHRALVRLAG